MRRHDAALIDQARIRLCGLEFVDAVENPFFDANLAGLARRAAGARADERNAAARGGAAHQAWIGSCRHARRGLLVARSAARPGAVATGCCGSARRGWTLQRCG
jgi:hypothetical protein